jgi:inosine/xanthosine triphosphate pyrophosphatase family protein
VTEDPAARAQAQAEAEAEAEAKAADRVVFFSDAVVAIAATLPGTFSATWAGRTATSAG